jgi:hypothetical protein
MRYLERWTTELKEELERNGYKLDTYDDILCGSDYINAVKTGLINKKTDIVLTLSGDGLQL